MQSEAAFMAVTVEDVAKWEQQQKYDSSMLE